MPDRQLPRLGDRAGLVIEATRGAVIHYRLGVDADMPLEDAERELIADVREAYVTSSIDRLMTVRYRNRSRQIDIQAGLTRLAPDHVRIDGVRIRAMRPTSGGRRGMARRVRGGVHEGTVRIEAGRIEWRDMGASEWRPASLQQLARDYAADHDVWEWLRRNGVTRPSPSGPTTPEADRETKQCMLRLSAAEIARLDDLAESAGLSRSELVRRWIARG